VKVPKKGESSDASHEPSPAEEGGGGPQAAYAPRLREGKKKGLLSFSLGIKEKRKVRAEERKEGGTVSRRMRAGDKG